jgi:hypothetical protein
MLQGTMRMPSEWKMTSVTTVDELLADLHALRAQRWFFRGHARAYGTLLPSIDRPPLQTLSRAAKLALERQSIETFRASARDFASAGERGAMSDDFVALMVLRHYGTPTRLLDWSASPFVAAHFAACGHDDLDGELWAFDEPLYEVKGLEQWAKWPQTTVRGNGVDFAAGLTAFLVEEPPDWFICAFYPTGFPRQLAQAGHYSMTARFSRDHADAIAGLLGDGDHCRRYVVPSSLKPALRAVLRERHGIWRGALYPDSAGAAETAAELFPKSSGSGR